MKDEEHVNHDAHFQEKLDSLKVRMAHIAKKYL
jgi:translation initiation factor IF-1